MRALLCCTLFLSLLFVLLLLDSATVRALGGRVAPEMVELLGRFVREEVGAVVA